ncbi:TPA: host specificity protein J [Salmonella enterica subsp. salamae]|nr:host specificity protein J [Salmonella enterica subsp. salamae]
MSKHGGKGHTPHEAPDNLKSTQVLSVIDALSEGPVEGPVRGLHSILVNDTPVVDADGQVNVHGVKVIYRVGEQEQTPLEGFEESGAETRIGAEIKHDLPVTRTITSRETDRLRLTFGVQMLEKITDKGDRESTQVNLQIHTQRAGKWVTEKNIIIDGKTTSQYLASIVLDNLPPRPFGIRMVRITPDSTTDRLQNKTYWSGYTEIISLKQAYPNTAVVGVQVDAEQFGSQQAKMNYHIRGRIVRVPSNYNAITRRAHGIWDGTFIPAWSDNPAWCLLDMLTHPRYGIGNRLKIADVDIWALYAIARYCDQPVPDGFGSSEPRMSCNAYLTTQRKAHDVLADFCSLMRCMPVWNGSQMTFIQDRPSDTAWTYTNSNVTEGRFIYSFSALKDRHNAVEVRYVDPRNGWKTSTELVEDQASIARYGRNLLKMDAFGCTSRGQARRTGLWVIQTELLETQTVDFSVGAEGLRHTPGDIIEVCDNDYSGAVIGGRIIDMDISTRTLTLDREISLPESGTATMNIIGPDGQPFSTEIQSQPAADRVVMKVLPETMQSYGIWGLKLPSLKRRLFRCVCIKENDDGTYAITAVQHVPEKEAIVDNGAHFSPLPSVIPKPVPGLTVAVSPDSNGGYSARAQWEIPEGGTGWLYRLRLTTEAGAEDEPQWTPLETVVKETSYTLSNLAPGNYQFRVQAVSGPTRQSAPTSVMFSIALPEAPVRIDVIPGFYQITLVPHQSSFHNDVQYEFWFSETRTTDMQQTGEQAQKLGTAVTWTQKNLMKTDVDYFFLVRSVNGVGKSAFVEVSGRVSQDASGYLSMFRGKIGQDMLASGVTEQLAGAPEAGRINPVTALGDRAVSNKVTWHPSGKGERVLTAIITVTSSAYQGTLTLTVGEQVFSYTASQLPENGSLIAVADLEGGPVDIALSLSAAEGRCTASAGLTITRASGTFKQDRQIS